MNTSAFLIAASETDSTVKIVFGLVAAGIWILAQVMSAWNERKKTQNQKEPLPPRPPRSTRPGAPVPPPKDAPRPPRPPRSVPPQPRPQQRSFPQTSSRRQPSAPPPLRQETVIVAEERAPVVEGARRTAATAATADNRGASGLPDRRDRLKSILRPRNLKKEFILTEILQPPISVRAVADR